MTRPSRTHGSPPIRDLAVIGDRTTAALVALDGAIEWLCLPAFDGPPVFGRLVDPARGGHFTLAPVEPFEARRAYLPDANVLETTFTTARGVVRVMDALAWSPADARGDVELIRRVEGVAGSVAVRWVVEPRGGYERREFAAEPLGAHHVLRDREVALTVEAWGSGAPRSNPGRVEASFACEEGDRVTVAVRAFLGQPVAVDPREDVERRLDETTTRWRAWAARCAYDGPWRSAVLRSALVLGLLTHEASGAMVAAPTTSLPERLGGDRN